MPISPERPLYVPAPTDDVRPFGGVQAQLPGPFAYKVRIGPGEPGAATPTLAESRKDKKPMVALSLTVVAVGKGAPADAVGRSVTHNEFWPDSNNFAQGNKEGNRNRVAMGKIMAMFRAAGFTEDQITKAFLRPNRQVTAETVSARVKMLQGKEIAIFYEPTQEGDKQKYASIQWIAPEMAADLLAGTFVPKTQRLDSSNASGDGGGSGGGNAGGGHADGGGDDFADDKLFESGGSSGGGSTDTDDWG